MINKISKDTEWFNNINIEAGKKGLFDFSNGMDKKSQWEGFNANEEGIDFGENDFEDSLTPRPEDKEEFINAITPVINTINTEFAKALKAVGIAPLSLDNILNLNNEIVGYIETSEGNDHPWRNALLNKINTLFKQHGFDADIDNLNSGENSFSVSKPISL